MGSTNQALFLVEQNRKKQRYVIHKKPMNSILIENKVSLVIRSVCLTFFVVQKPNFRLSQQSCNFEKMWNGKRKYKVFFLSRLSHCGVKYFLKEPFDFLCICYHKQAGEYDIGLFNLHLFPFIF